MNDCHLSTLIALGTVVIFSVCASVHVYARVQVCKGACTCVCRVDIPSSALGSKFCCLGIAVSCEQTFFCREACWLGSNLAQDILFSCPIAIIPGESGAKEASLLCSDDVRSWDGGSCGVGEPVRGGKEAISGEFRLKLLG